MARKYTKLDTDTWKVICNLYQTGVNSVEELSETYQVSTSAIQQRVRAKGIVRRAAFTPKSGLAAAISAVSSLAPIVDTGTIEERIVATNNAAYLGSLAIQRMLELSVAAFSSDPPTNPIQASATIRALEQAASVQDKLNRIRRTVLRLDKDNQNADVILPELPIREMMPEEVAALRLRQQQEDAAIGSKPFGMRAERKVISDIDDVDDRLAEGCEDEMPTT